MDKGSTQEQDNMATVGVQTYQDEGVKEQTSTQDESPILSRQDLKNIIETLLFITDRALSVSKINQVAEINDLTLTRDIISELQNDYANAGRAIQVIEIGGGFQMSTKPEYGRWVRKLYNEKMSTRLSPAALETLAIVAYKQPITRAEIEAIRGVDVSGPLEKILERGLAKIVGKKDAPGRPMVYATTDEFLRLFGLNNVSELPDLKTFASKGLKEVQSDLPFSEPIPAFKENILPLTDEENLPNRETEEDEEDIEVLPTQGNQPEGNGGQLEPAPKSGYTGNEPKEGNNK